MWYIPSMIIALKDINQIKEELSGLKSVIIGLIGRDEEGEYNPDFVKRVLKAAKEKPRYTFQGKKIFLGQLRRNASRL